MLHIAHGNKFASHGEVHDQTSSPCCRSIGGFSHWTHGVKPFKPPQTNPVRMHQTKPGVL
jgi:hypothetical protein